MMLCLNCRKRPVLARGRCAKCYREGAKAGTFTKRTYQPVPAVCSYPGCTQPGRAKGYCRKHYQRNYRHTDPSICYRQEKEGRHV